MHVHKTLGTEEVTDFHGGGSSGCKLFRSVRERTHLGVPPPCRWRNLQLQQNVLRLHVLVLMMVPTKILPPHRQQLWSTVLTCCWCLFAWAFRGRLSFSHNAASPRHLSADLACCGRMKSVSDGWELSPGALWLWWTEQRRGAAAPHREADSSSAGMTSTQEVQLFYAQSKLCR